MTTPSRVSKQLFLAALVLFFGTSVLAHADAAQVASSPNPIKALHARPAVCCGFTQDNLPSHGVATAIATNGGTEFALDDTNYSSNGHALYQNGTGGWKPFASPGGVQVAVDVHGEPYLLTSNGTLYTYTDGGWITFTSQSEPFSYIGSDACNCYGPYNGEVSAVGTIVRNGKGYGAYGCSVVTGIATCSGPSHGSPSDPPDNYLALVNSSATASDYPSWAINGDGNVYESLAGSSPWVEKGTLKPISLSSNADGTYALTSAGALKDWNGTSWVTFSAPTASVVSVGPNHVWLLDLAGDIYWR
jgi:hypothetical protein